MGKIERTISLEEVKSLIQDSGLSNKDTVLKFSENDKGQLLFNGQLIVGDDSGSEESTPLSIIKWRPEIKIKDNSLINYKGFMYISEITYITGLYIQDDLKRKCIYPLGFGNNSIETCELVNDSMNGFVDLPSSGILKLHVEGSTKINKIDIDKFDTRIDGDITSVPNRIIHKTNIIYINNMDNDVNVGEGQFVRLIPNTDYTISFKCDDDTMLSIYDASSGLNMDNYLSRLLHHTSDKLFVFNSGLVDKVFITISKNSNNTDGEIKVEDLMLLQGSYIEANLPRFCKNISVSKPRLLNVKGNLFDDRQLLVGDITSDNINETYKTHKHSHDIYLDYDKVYSIITDKKLKIVSMNNTREIIDVKENVNEITNCSIISIINNEPLVDNFFSNISIVEKGATVEKHKSNITEYDNIWLGEEDYIVNGKLHKKWSRYRLSDLVSINKSENMVNDFNDNYYRIEFILENILSISSIDNITAYFKNFYFFLGDVTTDDKNIPQITSSIKVGNNKSIINIDLFIPKYFIDKYQKSSVTEKFYEWVLIYDDYIYLKKSTYNIEKKELLYTSLEAYEGKNYISKSLPVIIDKVFANIDRNGDKNMTNDTGYLNKTSIGENQNILSDIPISIRNIYIFENGEMKNINYMCKIVEDENNTNGKYYIQIDNVPYTMEQSYYVEYIPSGYNDRYNVNLSYINSYKDAYDDLKEFCFGLKNKIDDLYNIINEKDYKYFSKNVDIITPKPDGYIYCVSYNDGSKGVRVMKMNPSSGSEIYNIAYTEYNLGNPYHRVTDKYLILYGSAGLLVLNKQDGSVMKYINAYKPVVAEPIAIYYQDKDDANIAKRLDLVDFTISDYLVPSYDSKLYKNYRHLYDEVFFGYVLGGIGFVDMSTGVTLAVFKSFKLLSDYYKSIQKVITKKTDYYGSLDGIVEIDEVNMTYKKYEIINKKQLSQPKIHFYDRNSHTVLLANNYTWAVIDLKNNTMYDVPIAKFDYNNYIVSDGVEVSDHYTNNRFITDSKLLYYNYKIEKGIFKPYSTGKDKSWIIDFPDEFSTEKSDGSLLYSKYRVLKEINIAEIISIDKYGNMFGLSKDKKTLFVMDPEMNIKYTKTSDMSFNVVIHDR